MSNIKILTFNCKSTEQALIQLGSTNFSEGVAAEQHFLRVETEISETYYDNISVKSIDDIFIGIKKPILISFISKNDRKIKTFWKNRESNDFKSLSYVGDSDKLISKFLHRFLIQEIDKNESGILKSSQNKKSLNIQDIGSQDGRNLLLIACEKNDLNVVEKLLEFNFDVDYEDDDKFIAIEIAWDNFVENDSNKVHREINENIMITLLSANSMFPRKISDRKCKIESELIKQFLKKNDKLHAIVQQMDKKFNRFNKLIKKINEIRKNHKHMRKFYNKDNKSLMLAAFESENIAVWDKLMEHGVFIGQHEINSFAKSCIGKESTELSEFRKRSRLHAFNYPKYHLQILLSRSKINYNDQNPSDHWKILKKAYETIDENETCSIILQVAATWNKLDILFDFVNNTACYANPTTSINSRGTSDDSGRITIGAKNLLLDGDTRNEVLGVITQELCHTAMLVVYMNNFNPYKIGDSEKEKEFENEVIEECERNQKVEKLIEVVFTSYSEQVRSAELITRPPHIWMHHLNNPQHIELCEESYPQLYNFFNDCVVNEMEKYLKLYPKLHYEDYEIEFDELTDPIKAKIANTELEFNGITNSIHRIIDDETEEYDILKKLQSKEITDWIIHNKPIEFEQNIKHEEQIASIERELIPYNYNQEVYDSENFDKMPTPFILADEPGSGKTETMKLMAMKFQNRHNYFWTSYISLKKHQSKIRAIRNNSESVENVLIKILDLELKIEAKIFYHLLERGLVILLFDGYDEVCSGSNEFPIEAFKALQAKGITISISTRPHYTKSLENNLKIETYMLKPLSIEQKKEIIKSVHSTIDDVDKKPIEDVLKKLEKLLEIIKQNEWYEQEFNNPLLISILAELYTSQKDSMKPEEDLNIYNVFDKMTLMLEEKVRIKISRHESSSFIYNKITNREVHQVLALKSSFPYNSIKNLKIMNRWKLVGHEWSVDRIQRFGLVILEKEFEKDLKPNYINVLCIDNSRKSKIYLRTCFVHKRYEEFFVATYIIDFITGGFDEKEFQEFLKFISFYSIYYYTFVDKFIICKIEHEKKRKENCKI